MFVWSFLLPLFLLPISQAVSDQDATQQGTHQIRKREVCPKRVLRYHNEKGILPMTENQAKKSSHVVYSYADLDANGSVSVEVKPKEDSGRLRDMMKVASKGGQEDMRMMFSIGGSDKSQHFPALLATSESRERLSLNIMKFLIKYYLGGVEIAWRHPRTAQDRQNLVAFMEQLRSDLTKFEQWTNPLKVGLALPGQQDLLVEAGYDLPALAPSVDFFNVIFEGNATQDQIHSVMKYIACKVGTDKLNLGVSLSDTADGLKKKVSYIREYGLGGVAISPHDSGDLADELFNVVASVGSGEFCTATSTYQCGEATTTTTPKPPPPPPTTIGGNCNNCNACQPDGRYCYNCCVDPQDGRGDKAGCNNCRYCGGKQGPCTNCCNGPKSGCNNCMKENLGNCC